MADLNFNVNDPTDFQILRYEDSMTDPVWINDNVYSVIFRDSDEFFRQLFDRANNFVGTLLTDLFDIDNDQQYMVYNDDDGNDISPSRLIEDSDEFDIFKLIMYQFGPAIYEITDSVRDIFVRSGNIWHRSLTDEDGNDRGTIFQLVDFGARFIFGEIDPDRPNIVYDRNDTTNFPSSFNTDTLIARSGFDWFKEVSTDVLAGILGLVLSDEDAQSTADDIIMSVSNFINYTGNLWNRSQTDSFPILNFGARFVFGETIADGTQPIDGLSAGQRYDSEMHDLTPDQQDALVARSIFDWVSDDVLGFITGLFGEEIGMSVSNFINYTGGLWHRSLTFEDDDNTDITIDTTLDFINRLLFGKNYP